MTPETRPASTARLLPALALVCTLFGLGQVLHSAWEQDWTYDEPYHMQWARRLFVERVSERKSDPLWNSKTPIMMVHVLFKQAARSAGLREGRPVSFCARVPGAVCYLTVLCAAAIFARRRLGLNAAALTVMALALDPNLIAHSAVATVDAPYTLFTLLTLLCGVRLAECPTLGRACVLGLTLGLAFATKFTAFLLIPGLLLLPLCFGLAAFRSQRRHLLLLALLVALLAVLTVDVAYLFVDVGRPLGLISWKSTQMIRVASALPHLRLPLPADFLTGLDICLAHERGRAWSVLILDRRYPDGVWWYFLVSYVLKTPLLLVLGQLVGLLRLLRTRLGEQRPLVLFLALNLLLSLLYFSFLFRAQIGYRYVLMCLPLLVLLAARGWSSLEGPWLPRGAVLVAALAALELVPYSGNALAFTSPLVQPKRQAFRFLTNSSIDWGQNDERVQPWMDRERERFRGQLLLWEPTHIRPGRNVIGLNSLAGGGSYNQHRWLREHREPEGHYRHTYLWFTIDPATYERFLDEDRRLRSRPEDEAACAPGPDLRPLALDTWRAFPENPEGSNAWIVCAQTPEGGDLALVGQNVGLLLGRAGAEMRDWDRLRGGEELVYRLEPGWHALAVIKAQLFVGRFELRLGTAELHYRPAILRKKGRFELWSPAPRRSAPAEDGDSQP